MSEYISEQTLEQTQPIPPLSCANSTNLRRIARDLSVNPQTGVNWVDIAAANLPAPPSPKERQKEVTVETLRFDELYTFVSPKKSLLTS